ncbi:MAG: aldehyde ferredoxin oxidoreductase family protein [Candidatus Njordarchaeia archaeon]
MKVKEILSRILYIDLTKKTFWVDYRPDLVEEWFGGAGLAIKLLEEELKPNVDPLSPENVIILAVGPITNVYPLASKTVAMFKSPLTGNLGESHAGGRSAASIMNAGYGAIVIKGKSERPLYVTVFNDEVKFKDATTLWGMRNSLTVGRVIAEAEPGSGRRAVLRIGRAGERLVRYACVITETFRHFGRLGLGAVFGSKKLKAIAISGTKSIEVEDKRAYRKFYKEIYETAITSGLMKKYHDLGTPMNVNPLNMLKALPTRNLKSAYFEDAEKISGEYYAENLLGRRVACSHCPVACIHLAALREPYVDEPYFYKTRFISYDYEPIYANGSMLGIGNAEDVLRIIDRIDAEGLDAMSTGVALAWTTEMLERGLISTKETLVKLEWGNAENYIKAIKYIVEQPTEFYQHLALGVKHAASVYGGKEFALVFGGNEMPGYHTGPAAHIGYTIGARHSHLDNAGYSLDQKLLDKEVSPEETVEKLVQEEKWRQVLSSLVVCFFARGIYKPPTVIKALETVGIHLTEDELMKIGEKTYFEKFKFKVREGFNVSVQDMPKRIMEVPTPRGMITEEYLDRALKHFKKIVLSKVMDTA